MEVAEVLDGFLSDGIDKTAASGQSVGLEIHDKGDGRSGRRAFPLQNAACEMK
ncbi:predicted protein [Botrytis cinerea T4]|uniref:Uncharacterized protein n=1 Tax=Botryotinia fuckeliana (strain T4) TaxID=999810 RepID=G2XQ33_BOTF4|nr:predicted protein [Botrytis cinerea T4]